MALENLPALAVPNQPRSTPGVLTICLSMCKIINMEEINQYEINRTEYPLLPPSASPNPRETLRAFRHQQEVDQFLRDR